MGPSGQVKQQLLDDEGAEHRERELADEDQAAPPLRASRMAARWAGSVNSKTAPRDS